MALPYTVKHHALKLHFIFPPLDMGEHLLYLFDLGKVPSLLTTVAEVPQHLRTISGAFSFFFFFLSP